MMHKKLVHRRDILRGAAGLAAAGLVGARSSSAFAQSAPGVTDNEILIGALGQLNGPFAFIGVPGRDNMQMTIDKLNAAGGINGRKLKLLFEQASTPAESVAAAKKLVEDDKVFVLVIATGSTGAAAAADYVRAAKIPTYNTVGATPIIRQPFARNVFHGTIPPASITGQALIDIGFQAAPKAKKVGVLAGTYAFPQSHLAEIKPRLEKRGGLDVTVEHSMPLPPTTPRNLVSFARHRVELVIILGSFKEAGFAIKQAPEKGLTDVIFVVDGSAVNNAIVPIIGADNTKNVRGYFNAPVLHDPGRSTDCELPQAAGRQIRRHAAAGPSQHLRSDRLWLDVYPRTGSQESRARSELGRRDRRLGDDQGCQAVRPRRL